MKQEGIEDNSKYGTSESARKGRRDSANFAHEMAGKARHMIDIVRHMNLDLSEPPYSETSVAEYGRRALRDLEEFEKAIERDTHAIYLTEHPGLDVTSPNGSSQEPYMEPTMSSRRHSVSDEPGMVHEGKYHNHCLDWNRKRGISKLIIDLFARDCTQVL